MTSVSQWVCRYTVTKPTVTETNTATHAKRRRWFIDIIARIPNSTTAFETCPDG
jgi:hypothetical protein